ncbi:MAG: hypothetical protein RIE56_01795, partial [Amphiplicatus sp.]
MNIMNIRHIAAFAAVRLLVGCERDGETRLVSVQGPDSDAEVSKIDEARTEFERAVATADYQALGASLAEGAVMVQPGSADWIAMREAAAGAPFPAG